MEIDDTDAVYGDNATFIDFFVPGIMALAVWLLTTMLTLLSFVGEKTTGTLERLQASPLTEGELVVGYAMAYGTLGMIQAALLMTVATLVFGITIVGNPLYAFLVVALLAVVSQNLGILLSSAARNEAQAVQMIPVVILPTFLLAGIFWPVEAIPSWLQPVSWAIPPTYAVEALRSVLLRGWGLERIIWPQFMALFAFAILFLGAAVALLRSRKK
jgi:ABC-2 type transport system permease protein